MKKTLKSKDIEKVKTIKELTLKIKNIWGKIIELTRIKWSTNKRFVYAIQQTRISFENNGKFILQFSYTVMIWDLKGGLKL